MIDTISVVLIELMMQIIRICAFWSILIMVGLAALMYIANNTEAKFPHKKYFLNGSSWSNRLDLSLGRAFVIYLITSLIYLVFH